MSPTSRVEAGRLDLALGRGRVSAEHARASRCSAPSRTTRRRPPAPRRAAAASSSSERAAARPARTPGRTGAGARAAGGRAGRAGRRARAGGGRPVARRDRRWRRSPSQRRSPGGGSSRARSAISRVAGSGGGVRRRPPRRRLSRRAAGTGARSAVSSGSSSTPSAQRLGDAVQLVQQHPGVGRALAAVARGGAGDQRVDVRRDAGHERRRRRARPRGRACRRPGSGDSPSCGLAPVSSS